MKLCIAFVLVAAATAHYGNPFNGPCLSDETNVTNVEGGGAICLPQCGVGKGKCPTDEPSGMTAKPDCFHSQKGKKFCIPMCSSASDCGTMGSCNSKGECTYTGPSGPTTPTPAPGPSPPTPAPAPPSPTPAPGPGPKPPKIPLQYTADITSVTKGDIPNLPRGTQVYSEAYDYGNKRRRVDVTQGQGQGTKKIYRYDVKDDGHNPFPAPRGYQIGQNPKLDCCWLWLIDTSDPTNTTNLEMDEVQVPPKATDEGACTIDGKAAEHWHAKGGVVVLESQSDWYLGPNASIIQQNSQFRLKLKTALGNATYHTFDSAPIDISIFDVPKANCDECEPPEMGDCKEFGKDPECDMSKYVHTGDTFYLPHVRPDLYR